MFVVVGNKTAILLGKMWLWGNMRNFAMFVDLLPCVCSTVHSLWKTEKKLRTSLVWVVWSFPFLASFQVFWNNTSGKYIKQIFSWLQHYWPGTQEIHLSSHDTLFFSVSKIAFSYLGEICRWSIILNIASLCFTTFWIPNEFLSCKCTLEKHLFN